VTRRQLFGSLLTLVFLVNLARVVFAPLLEPLRLSLGATQTELGLVATLAWLGSALPRIPMGYLLTRVPRHRVILGTGLVLTAAGAFTAIAWSVPTVMAGAFLMGLSSGAYFMAANPLVSELFPDSVGRAIGTHGTAAQVAAVAAPATVSVALLAGTWRFAVAGIGVAALLSTAAFWLVARRTALPDAGAADRDLLAAARHQWRIILAGVAVLGFAGFAWNGVFNFYVTYLTTVKALSSGTANALLTGVFAAGVPAFYVTGRLADRLPVVPLMLTILVAFAACLLALTVAAGVAALAAASLALGYAVHGMFPAVDTYLLGSLPDRHRASAYATYSGLMMIVQATGSSVVGALTDAGYAFDAVFRALGGGIVLVVVVLAVASAAGRLPATARAR
jgi:predicted MFS family arabinose efflux permease